MEGSSARAFAEVAAPLVGREQELEDLDQVLDRALQYQAPQSITLVGGQGVGKTRLVDHWLSAVKERHANLRINRCAAVPDGATYSLFTRLLEGRFGLREAADRSKALRAEVEEVLLDRRIAEFLHFLGTFVGVTVPDNPFLQALEEAPAQHDKISRTVLRRFIEMDALVAPCIIVLDDLHAADDGSLSLLRELAEGLEGAPVVLVGLTRPELFVRVPDFCKLEAEHVRIDLPLLGPAESQTLLRHLLSRAREIPTSLLESAAEMTAGNPFFMEELVRVLLANGTIRAQGEEWIIDAARAEEVELPMSVEEAVHARISVLTPPERDVLEKASTLGSVFWVEALVCFTRLQQEVARKADLWIADVFRETIQAILAGLAERDYVMKLPDSSIPTTAEYAFKHNLERELISKMVSTDRKRQYHLFAAQWLETMLPDRSEAQLEYLGHHYELGGNRRRAAFCFVHAGDKARARYANEQAATFYHRGLGLLDLDDALSKIEALHNLGDVCSVLGRNEEALRQFEEMLHYAWLLDHKAKGGAAHRRIGRIHRTLGDTERATIHLQIALRLFERAGDSRGYAATLDDIGQVSMLKGEYEQALEHHRRALTIKRDVGEPRAIAVALNNIGTVHQNSGSFKAALDCFVEALEIRKEVGDQLGVVDSLKNLGSVHRAQSDYSRAFDLWTEALALAREIGDRLDEAYLLTNLGETLIQLGKPREAEAHLQEASTLATDLGDRRLKADCARTLCEVRLALGDNEGAEKEARIAFEIAEGLGLKPETGAAIRALAEVYAARELTEENRSRATELFRQAIELFTDLGNDLELARTFAGFADYHDRCGQWEDADHFRSSADEIFSRLKGASDSS